MITEIEQTTSDIDWFFTNGEDIAFVASGGGKLPKSVAKSSENIKTLTTYLRDLPDRGDMVVNPDLSKVIPTRTVTEQYLLDFITMAQKGLWAFDKTILNNHSDTSYHLVAKPKDALKIRELPIEIRSMIAETLLEGAIKANLDISSFEL